MERQPQTLPAARIDVRHEVLRPKHFVVAECLRPMFVLIEDRVEYDAARAQMEITDSRYVVLEKCSD